MPKPNFLIVGPADDLSIDLFLSPGCKSKMNVSTVIYSYESELNKDWDFIYIRGPFVKADFDNQKIRDALQKVLHDNPRAYKLDAIQGFSDLLIEDKWQQYQLLKDMMPETRPLKSFSDDLSGWLIKKRISGRSRDIHFNINDLAKDADLNDYIVQRQLNIQTEFRAFMIGGKLELPLEVKSVKSQTSKTKVVGMRADAPSEVIKICQQVAGKLSLDFMGLDIAQTDSGFYLIEVNRSPQFVNFYKWNSINLAEELIEYIDKNR